MRHKQYGMLLIAAAVFSAVFALFADAGNILLSALQFPFGQIGTFLRFLSLSGVIGNLAAWLIYILLCAVPTVCCLLLARRKQAVKADGLLLLLTPILAVVLYKAINPYGSFLAATSTGLQMVNGQYGAVVYITLIGWLILRTVGAFSSAEEGALYKALGIFLQLLGILFVMSAFGGCFGDALQSMEALRAANQNSGSLYLTNLFIVLRCLTDALPYLLNTVTVFIALELLSAFAENSEDTPRYAERLAHWCGTTLTCTVIAGICFHVAQMLFLSSLRHLDASIRFPVGSVAFLLICFIASRIIAENKALRDDNDLFI